MKPRLWLNLFLALVVATLASLVYFQQKRPGETAYPLSALKSFEAVRVQIERPGMPALLLEKQQGLWRLVAPFQARADDNKLERLLEILSANGTQRLAATDLARFELDRPLLTLTINLQRFDFGMFNPLDQQQYVLTANTVYLVNARHFAAATAPAAEFADRQLFAAAEQPQRFEFSRRALILENGRWRADPPRSELSPDELNAWRDEWRHASSLITQPYAGAPSLGKILIRLHDGKQVVLSILQREPEFVVLRQDENLQYHLPAGLGKRLLAPLMESTHAGTAGS